MVRPQLPDQCFVITGYQHQSVPRHLSVDDQATLVAARKGVGPPGLNLIVATPDLFEWLPRPFQERIAYRSIRPAGTGWLVPRLHNVRITTGVAVNTARATGECLSLDLSDGSKRALDHVMLATGYQVDVSRYEFLSTGLLKQLCVSSGYPELSAGFESSVPGLHFVGAPDLLVPSAALSPALVLLRALLPFWQQTETDPGRTASR